MGTPGENGERHEASAGGEHKEDGLKFPFGRVFH